MENIKITTDNYEVIMNDDSFMVVAIEFISDGANSHKTFFEKEDIIRNTPKLFNKPINCLIKNGDFSTHANNNWEEKQQIAIGTIPESNNVELIVKEDGRTFQKVNAIIWKYLFPQAEAILKNRKKVSVSMEIDPIKFEQITTGAMKGYMKIIDWKYEAITFLGFNTNPAISGTNATIVKYSSESEYISDVMIKYGVAMNSYTIPEEISSNIKANLKKVQGNPMAINEAQNIINNHALNYSEIKSLVTTIDSLDNKDKALFDSESIAKWFNKIELERNGGKQKVEKIKELLASKFSDNLSYFSHDENNVRCFDSTVGQLKSYTYSFEEGSDEVDPVVTLDAEFSVVVKLEGSDTYKVEEDVAEGEVVEDLVMYSISAYSAIKDELEVSSAKNIELETKLTESASTDYAEKITEMEATEQELKNKVASLEETVANYAVVGDELTELRSYKEEKEEETKSEKINALYSKFSAFLDKDSIEVINSKVSKLTYAEIQNEVNAIVAPIMEQKIKALTEQSNIARQEETLTYSKYSLGSKGKETKKPITILERLERIK